MAPHFIIVSLLILSSIGFGSGQENTTWANKVTTSDGSTTTNLQFYFHDTFSGKDPTAVRVAEPTSQSWNLFGAMVMVDDKLTEGYDVDSKLVGRAQGLYGSASQSGLGLIMAITYKFVDGEYGGSSFSILGLNQALYLTREMPVVAGTGLFRMAKGYAIAKTQWVDVTGSGDAIVWYNVTLFH
ncbi:unnamed protein product [Rhodiola kirilowii]